MNLKHLTFNKIFLPEVASTNTFLVDLNKQGKLSEGTFVITSNQYKGKGQRGSEWKSEPNQNLMFSLILFPKCKVKNSFYLNIIASLAVVKTLKDLKIEAQIKWPNDVLVHQQKIAGILVENVIHKNEISQSVIGIGLNVKQTNFLELTHVTSLKLLNCEVEIEDVLKQLYGYLDFYYNLLKQSNFNLLLKLYYNHLYGYGEILQFLNQEGKLFEGVILGIDAYGKLKLKINNQQNIKTFDLKELRFVI